MRLGQLARKLALRPSQIVDYLSAQQIFPEEGSNARLTDDMTERIVLHFAPGRLNEIMAAEEKTPESLPTPESVQDEPVVSKIEEAVLVETTPSPAIASADVKLAEEKPEVIKAPKVELSGLKVLGKIELPEPKKKTASVSESPEGTTGDERAAETIPATEKKPGRTEPRVQTQHRRDNYAQRPARNPIAVQREQKAYEEEEKRKEKLEREKEKRTQYYLQRVKTGQPTKAVKIVSEPMESFHSREVKPAPKTWLGKFLRWLNT
jgi:hypothetical protein